ncbi:MAG: TldD/PmbA family protein [Deltaproteobacteria bacterium]|nr:TldD/PmbA family protein [Deltaproteobacteria bacterium]
MCEEVLRRLLQGGASDAKVVARTGQDLSVRVRLGETELVEEAGTRSVSVRAYKGQRVATSSTNDLTPEGLSRLISDALELADLSQEDPFAGLPDPSELCAPDKVQDLGLYDALCGDVGAGEAVERARRCEAAARGYDPRITNSEGASFGRTTGGYAMATSGGFRGGNLGSYASLSVQPVAADEGGRNRTASYWTARRRLSALEDAEAVGREAARRTVALLGARKVPTQEAPVVFEADAARSLLGLFAGCVTGDAIYRRSSFLVGRLDEVVASPLVTLVDDPLLPGGPGSRAFDGDGLPSRRNVVVERGALKTYLLDSYGARKLGLKSTGSSASVTGQGAGTSNFFLEKGAITREALLADTPRGLYVTGMMGFGFNPVTGDFSRGAHGFWIEGGALAYPVSEVTISLNFKDLLQAIDAVADDLDLKSGVASPTFRVERMTIAGS